MGGGHNLYVHIVEKIQDGYGQSGSFGGIGAGAQLIEEHQAIGIGLGQNADDIGHMGGEGAEALLDALLVANIGIDLPEYGKL